MRQPRAAESRQREREDDRLRALRRSGLLDAPPEEEFNRLTRLASDIFAAPVAMVTLLDADRLFFISQVGLPEPLASQREAPLARALTHEVFTGEPLVIVDSRMEPRVNGNPVFQELAVVAYAGVPLITVEGHVLGSLCVADRRPRTWSDEEIRILGALASAAVKEIERRTLAREEDAIVDQLVGQSATPGTPAVSPNGSVPADRDITGEQDLDRQKDIFLSSISHDLKNPLTIIKGAAQMIERQMARTGTVPAAQLTSACTTIQRAVQSMTLQLDEVLDVARTGRGQPLKLNLETTDLVALVTQVVADYPTADDLSPIRVGACDASLVGRWDASRVRRVLANLLENAVKYSPNAAEITVTVHRVDDAGRRAADGPWAELSVADRGIGIPAADLPRVFRRFQRARNVRGTIPGSGIGLADVQQVVAQHGGTVHVHSVQGAGSTFTVRLPLEPSVPAQSPGGLRSAAQSSR